MAKKHRVSRARHRNSVKNKGNAKHGFKHKHHRTKPKSKYHKAHTFIFTPTAFDWSTPHDSVEACMARVENGMKCYCLEKCHCRNCNGCRNLKLPDDCRSKCHECPNCVPCR